MTVLSDQLEMARVAIDEIRARRLALKRAKPKIMLYKNPDDPDATGLVYRGRLNARELTKGQFPDVENVSSAGMFEVRASHYLAKWIMTIPNTPEQCKNVVIRTDMYGGKWRWTGLMHHWDIDTRDGVDYLTATFNDDKQFLSFMLCPPNPLLPIPLFQFPRDWLEFGPSAFCIGLMIFINIWRLEGHPFTLPDDPGDITQYLDIINLSGWQVHCEVPKFFSDSSLWTFIGSRMNQIDSVIAAALDDGQLTLGYRRIFTDEGEKATGLLDNDIANGALTFFVRDKSGFARGTGAYLSGNAVTGLGRSIIQWGSGFVEDTTAMFQDDETLWADEYYQSGFLGTLAGSPPYTIRDSKFNDIQSHITHSPATAVSVIVGGDNPTADAIVNLIITSTGNLIGYFLLGGFDSLGDIASEIIMPFLVGTILAWDEWKNFGRAKSLGWVHLHEIYNAGAEQNAWSLNALSIWRGGFKATDSETSHTAVIDGSTWLIPGLHAENGDRLGSTSAAFRRATKSHIIFVNRFKEMGLQIAEDGLFEFPIKIGENKAAMSVGERTARMFKDLFAKISDVGVHLVQ
jgi:hypothetical protein